MTCAKASFAAWLLGNDGRVYVGWNHALYPQSVCPRAPGEGYEKCHSVCATTGHAEANAIKKAGDAAWGGFLIVDYHYICDDCMSKIEEKGITAMTVEEFLAQGGEVERLGNTVKFKVIPIKHYRIESPPVENRYVAPPDRNIKRNVAKRRSKWA